MFLKVMDNDISDEGSLRPNEHGKCVCSMCFFAGACGTLNYGSSSLSCFIITIISLLLLFLFVVVVLVFVVLLLLLLDGGAGAAAAAAAAAAAGGGEGVGVADDHVVCEHLRPKDPAQLILQSLSHKKLMWVLLHFSPLT